MKALLLKICTPLLNHLESGDDNFEYKSSHRTILIIAGVFFWVVSLFSLFIFIKMSKLEGLVPVAIFLLAGTVCGTVGFLGSDKAVARIWKSK